MNESIKNLGARERRLDIRDIQLGRVQAPIDIPETFIDHRWNDVALYQDGYPTCGAHAGAFLTMFAHYREHKEIKDMSPRFLWRKIKDIDGYAIDDGTDMRSIFKALRSAGVCDYDMLPNIYGVNTEEYSHPMISQAMADNAHVRIIKSYAFLDDLSMQGIKRAVYENGAVLLLIYAGTDFWRTQYPIATRRTNGHFVVAYNYDKDHIIIKDSTESDPSLSTKYLNASWIPMIREGGTEIDLPDDYVRDLLTVKELAQRVIDLYHKIIGKGRNHN